jgi:hypothetical protein
VCLVARYLEANGIPTVIVGSAIDIVEHCGVPRFLFTDFPLGNPCGIPYQPQMQSAIIETALDLLESATEPRTIVRTPFRWNGDKVWRQRYLEVRADNVAELARKGVELRARRKRLKTEGQGSS